MLNRESLSERHSIWRLKMQNRNKMITSNPGLQSGNFNAKSDSPSRNLKVNLKNFTWINKPASFRLRDNSLIIDTEPDTDFWQRTYYGFSNKNGPAFLTETEGDFTFSVKTSFEMTYLYDQCGILMYLDDYNWIKASVEYENREFARLGSVVTNLGYSDWATTDIPAGVTEMWYRLSCRSQDFYIEYSSNGIDYKQMRMLHLHKPISVARVGVYGCSPLKSSFRAIFSDFRKGPCEWPPHVN